VCCCAVGGQQSARSPPQSLSAATTQFRRRSLTVDTSLAQVCAFSFANLANRRRKVVITPVAVEKLGFPKISANSGDRKCLGDPRKSFVEHPDALYFWQISRKRVFQQPRLITTTGESHWFIRLRCYFALSWDSSHLTSVGCDWSVDTVWSRINLTSIEASGQFRTMRKSPGMKSLGSSSRFASRYLPT
jgi:hypothetical protein